MRPATLFGLGLLLFGACECEEPGFTELVPLLSPDAARVRLPDVYVGASKEATLLYHSSGTGHVEVERVTLQDATAEGFALIDAGADVVAPGDALTVRVSFTPVAPGPASVVVVVDSDAENGPTRILLETSGLAPLDCGETTTCQRRTFMPQTGECLIEDLEGPCDDENACTEDDACLEGACVGVAVTCPSPFSCTQGLCDADEGCVLLAHDEACEDDGNPCTVERCDLEQGCVSEVLVDGTPCGTITACASASLCYGGACTVFDVPDGTPCNDGDFCTVGDECNDGECGGTRVEREPVVAGEVRTFGAEGGQAALLSGGRILFLDPHTRGALLASATDLSGAWGGYVATVVSVDDDGMQVLAQTDFPDERLPWPVEAAPGVVIGLSWEEDVTRAQRFEVAADGTVTLAATVETPPLVKRRAAALPDGRLVVVEVGDRLSLLQPADLSLVPLAQLPTVVNGTSVGIKGMAPFAGGLAVASARELLFVGLDGTVSSLDDSLGLLAGLASDGDLLAASACDNTAVSDDCRVTLFGASFEELAQIPVGQGLRRPVALDGSRLVVGREGPATAYDISDPAAPVTLAQTLPWSADSVDAIHFRDGVGLLLHERAFIDVAAPPLVAALDEDGLDFLLHPRLGSPGLLQAQESRLLAASSTSAHHVDVAQGGAPLVLAGAPLTRPFGWVGRDVLSLVLSNNAALLPLGLYAYAPSTTVRAYQVSVPALPPVPVRTFTLPVAGRLASNERLLVGFEPGSAEQALLLFDLVSLPDGEETSSSPLSRAPLLWSVTGTSTTRANGVAIDEDNQIAVLSAPTTEEPVRAELLLFDAAVPEAPVLTGRGSVHFETPEQGTAGAFHVAISGSSVVVLDLSPPAARVLRRLPDGAVVQAMQFATDESRILRFDGRTLVLGGFFTNQISFWDVSGAAPVHLGTMTLPDEPVDAEPFADTLVVSGQSSIVTLDPPCPPLP